MGCGVVKCAKSPLISNLVYILALVYLLYSVSYAQSNTDDATYKLHMHPHPISCTYRHMISTNITPLSPVP